MRIAIVGTGATGSVYAGLLADAGHQVWAIERWREHVEAIRTRGLRVTGASGYRVSRPAATTDPREVGTVDLVVIATKAADVDCAAGAAIELLGADTVVLPIQNGLGSRERVASIVGPRRVLAGVIGGFGASIVAPGHVHHHGMELVRLGECSGPVSERVETVAEAWRAAGFTVRTYDDIDQLVWEKLICNAAFSAVCALTGLTIGEVMADTDAWSIASACATEAFGVARAQQIVLSFEDPVAWVRAFGEAIPDASPSMLLDVRAGRASEIDVINGAIPPLATKLGLDAPVNRTVSGLVHAIERSGAASRATLRHRSRQTPSEHGETPPSPPEFRRKPPAG
ncbi:MAG TPA: 2-dehydropantoate 2-reductase [Solirubrobacteraceae bacterium]|nr:2-dehydropantoate 2-reductase [Solirubrobacteraceae bacterium]